jgi:hypothetical protein
MIERFFATLKELRLLCGANRDTTPFRVAKTIFPYDDDPGLPKLNPGLELANAFSVMKSAEFMPEPAFDFISGRDAFLFIDTTKSQDYLSPSR